MSKWGCVQPDKSYKNHRHYTLYKVVGAGRGKPIFLTYLSTVQFSCFWNKNNNSSYRTRKLRKNTTLSKQLKKLINKGKLDTLNTNYAWSPIFLALQQKVAGLPFLINIIFLILVLLKRVHGLNRHCHMLDCTQGHIIGRHFLQGNCQYHLSQFVLTYMQVTDYFLTKSWYLPKHFLNYENIFLKT